MQQGSESLFHQDLVCFITCPDWFAGLARLDGDTTNTASVNVAQDEHALVSIHRGGRESASLVRFSQPSDWCTACNNILVPACLMDGRDQPWWRQHPWKCCRSPARLASCVPWPSFQTWLDAFSPLQLLTPVTLRSSPG